MVKDSHYKFTDGLEISIRSEFPFQSHLVDSFEIVILCVYLNVWIFTSLGKVPEEVLVECSRPAGSGRHVHLKIVYDVVLGVRGLVSGDSNLEGLVAHYVRLTVNRERLYGCPWRNVPEEYG